MLATAQQDWDDACRTGLNEKKGPVRSKKVKHDGIQFASGLEKHMYIALKKAKIKAQYEGQTYELVPSFNFDQEAYERQE